MLKGTYALMGDWASAFAQTYKAREILATLPDNGALRARLVEQAFWMLLWAGRYREAELDVTEALATVEATGDVDFQAKFHRDRMLAVGLQGKVEDALSEMEQHRRLRRRQERGPDGSAIGFLAAVLLKAGDYAAARQNLEQALLLQVKGGNNLGVPELLCWLGERCELRHDFPEAREYYRRCVEEFGWVRRWHFHCGALIGLARTSYILGDYSALSAHLSEAEALAERFEYNDHLAALYLLRGYMAWQGRAPGLGDGFELVLESYKAALVYALRFNRFLLDEALSGKPKGSSLLAIIPTSLARKDGRGMLAELRTWWLTERNTVGSPRAGTVSQLVENTPLIEAEQTARSLEPGDGTPQSSVIDQIDRCLGFHVPLLPGESILHIQTPPIQPAHELPSTIEALMRLTNVDRPEDIGTNGPSVAAKVMQPNEGVEALRKFEVLFGRDALRVALDLADQYPRLLRTTILALTQLQGMEYDRAREEEPGRIIHEHRDPASDLIAKRITQDLGWSWPYYGSVDATPMYAQAIQQYCLSANEGLSFLDTQCVGRDGKAHSIEESLDLAIGWIERRLDGNAEGLLEFKPLFDGSIENQAWKDSWDSYHHADGRLANHSLGSTYSITRGAAVPG
jgi:tetratricopeptide (TPR) repeat protein